MILAGKTERAEHLVCGRGDNACCLACTRLGDRDAPKELIDAADLVTEMTEIKHPFQAGIRAQRGIEF